MTFLHHGDLGSNEWIKNLQNGLSPPQPAGMAHQALPWMAGGLGRHKILTGEPTSSVGGLQYIAATGARKFRRQIRPNHGAGSVDAPLCTFWNVQVTCVFFQIFPHLFVPMFCLLD